MKNAKRILMGANCPHTPVRITAAAPMGACAAAFIIIFPNRSLPRQVPQGTPRGKRVLKDISRAFVFHRSGVNSRSCVVLQSTRSRYSNVRSRLCAGQLNRAETGFSGRLTIIERDLLYSFFLFRQNYKKPLLAGQSPLTINLSTNFFILHKSECEEKHTSCRLNYCRALFWDTMKHLTHLFLLCTLLLCGLVPAGWCADPVPDTSSGFITVTNPPVADFYTSNQYGTGPFTITFSDASSGAEPMTWFWDFGDGTTSVRQNPTHTFKANGDYTVSLTVTNQYGSTTKTMPAYIRVGIPPVAEFSAVPRDGAVPLLVRFTDESTGRPDAWNWNFGDGTTSADQNPVHSYTGPGHYFVTLRVSNHFGSDGLTKSDLITVASPAEEIPGVTDTPGTQRAEGFAGLIQQARGTMDKNLPTAGFIPPQYMALAAVLTSIAILLLQILIANIAFLAQLALKFLRFFAELLGEHVVGILDEKEIAARRLAVRKLEPQFLGLSSTELLVIEGAVIIVALAFLLADRAELTLEMVLIYLAVGAVSVVLHDFAHRFFASRHGQDADTRFWGLGTLIMFVTAWLFGNAFAQPYRNLVNRNDDDLRKAGIEMVAGPVVSIILTFVFLAMVTLGGTWAIAGGIGFTINLIMAVYSLMPIKTMDGLEIWRWNRGLYLALFVPMAVFYFYVFSMA